MSFEYHYTFDAATLLEQCSSELQEVMRTSKSMGRRTCLTMLDLQTALSASQDLLLQHFQSLLEQERLYASPALHELFAVHDEPESAGTAANHNNNNNNHNHNQTFASVVGFLRLVAEHRQIESQRQRDDNIKESKMDDDSYHAMNHGDDEVDPFHLSPCCYYPNRNASGAMLFRLIVVLQLCLVRLDDARYVLTGRRRRRSDDGTSRSGAVISSTSSSRSSSTGSHFHQSRAITHHHNHFHLYHRTVCHTLVHAAAYMGTLLYGTGYLASTQRHQVQWRIIMCTRGGGSSYSNNPTIAAKSMAWTAGGLGMAAVTAGWLRQTWNTWWMSSKIVDSTRAVELWNRNWHAMQAANNLKQRVTSSRSSTFSSWGTTDAVVQADVKSKTAMMSTCAVKADRVVLYSLNSRPENALCNSKGEARFLVLKRAMDLVYTSMDSSPTSSSATRFFDPLDQHVAGGAVECPWRLQLAEAAFYASIGDRHRAMEVAASSRAARDLLHNLWGGNNASMASLLLPPIKTLSLRASQLLHQGAAAVADRIEICGITCFVLSREPIPEMASAIKHFHHRHGRRSSLLRALSSIHEDEEEDERHQSLATPQRRRSRTPFEKRNVIFHLTGGGFFSHTIASDLPNLLHWSEVTGAVVICPEYGLLPEHTFPSALGHVERVYRALLSSNVAKSLLGFEVNRLIVTGESAGGHLAVSLCTKLISDSMDTGVSPTVILPNAFLCSCPVLDLSLGTSNGADDIIAPDARGDVVTAISEAYLPSEYRIERQDPRASPLYATNAVLCKFPPTSICFAKENDSSVLFCRRLEMAGVHDSVLRPVAPHHLPNNYLGLGMTGFPDESHEQYDCISKWLCSQFGSM